MADLSELDRAGAVKIAGSNPATGLEDNFLEVDASGRISVKLYDGSGSIVNLGQAAMAASLPVVIASNQTTLNVNATNFPTTVDVNYGAISANSIRVAAQLGNAAGSIDYNAGNSSAQTIRVVVATNQSALPVTGTFWQTTQPVSGTVTANQGTSPWVVSGSVSVSNFPADADALAQGSTTSGQLGALIMGATTTAAPTYTTATTNPLSLTTTGLLRVDGSGVTQPISAASLPLPTGASTSALQTTGNTSLSSIDGKLVDNFGVATAALRVAAQLGNATGAADFNAGTTSAQTLRVVLPTDQSAIPVTQSGTWTVNQGTSPWITKDQSDGPVTPGTAASFSSLIGGQFNTALPTLTNTQQSAFQLDSSGRLIIRPLTSSDVVSAVQSGTWNIGTLTSITNPVTVNQGTSPWVISGTVAATQSGTWTTGRTWTLGSGTDSVTVIQGTSPWAISAASLPLPTGAATEATLVKLPLTQGSTTSGQSGPLMQGAVTTAAPTYTTGQTDPLSLTTTGLLRVDGSGVIQPISAASLPLPTGAATSALQTTGNTSLSSILTNQTNGTQITQVSNFPATQAVTQSTSPWITKDQSDGPVTPGTVASFSQLMGGQFNTALPTLTTGQQSAIQLDSSGRLIISPATQTVTGTVAVSNFPATVDTNYGTVGANTLRGAAQIGNATGAADFNAGTTGAQTLRTQANQGAPGTAANAWFEKITDGTDTAKVTTNSDLSVSDGLRNGGVYGAITLTTGNTSYEAKVGASRLSNRKSLSITAMDDMFWGYDSSVTTTSGTPLYKNQQIIFAIDPDSTFQVWIVATANNKTARITEST